MRYFYVSVLKVNHKTRNIHFKIWEASSEDPEPKLLGEYTHKLSYVSFTYKIFKILKSNGLISGSLPNEDNNITEELKEKFKIMIFQLPD